VSKIITNQTILIVGASRGIGLGLVKEYLSRQWRVIATERVLSDSSDLALLALASDGNLRVEQVDINRREEITNLAERLRDVSLDVLFINAGVSDDPEQTINQISTEEFVHLMVTNALSPLRSIEVLSNLVKPKGCIAAMSSALASVSSNTSGGYEVYRASKAALNMLLRSYAARAGNDRTIFALMPGWVRTSMGGLDAPIDVETSAKGLSDTINNHAGQSGLFFVDFQSQAIPW